MRTLKIVLVVIIAIIAIAGAGLFLMGYLKPKPAGIRISTNSTADVYINGAIVGKTPYRGTFNAGEISLKLVPRDQTANLLSYETKINLISGIETVVRREFATTEDASSGDVLTFERGVSKETSLIVISTPDNAQVSIDGSPRGFSPYKTLTITPAQHQITVKADGYTDRIMTINTFSGYQLTVFAKLAKGETLGAEPSPTPTPAPSTTFVQIGTTPTGFLRVRTEPGTKGEEIAQVKPGDKFKYIETDQETGWYKIQYEEPKAGLPNGIIGWVSNQFTSLVDQNGNEVTPTTAPSMSP